MNWPAMVSGEEIQSRLINDGVPVERAMQITSEIRQVQVGGRYRVQLPDGALVLYAVNHPGWFAVTAEQ